MTSVALFRGINVGGHRKLPMAMLKQALEAAGAEDPQTYIQTGNAVFDGPATATGILDEIESRAGFRPTMMLLDAKAFLDIRAANPFPEAVGDHKALHVFSLADRSPVPEAELLDLKGPEERLSLTDDALYLHSPEYLSGSQIAPRAEALLKTRATARNWRTIDAIADMIQTRR